jgi:hypothetical protein
MLGKLITWAARWFACFETPLNQRSVFAISQNGQFASARLIATQLRAEARC